MLAPLSVAVPHAVASTKFTVTHAVGSAKFTVPHAVASCSPYPGVLALLPSGLGESSLGAHSVCIVPPVHCRSGGELVPHLTFLLAKGFAHAVLVDTQKNEALTMRSEAPTCMNLLCGMICHS